MKKLNFKIDEIALILIVALLAMFISIHNKGNDSVEMKAEKITGLLLDNHGVSFANNGIIDGTKLAEIKNMDYYEFKDSINVKNDFCIYIEDENGNIILAKGSPKLAEYGIPCRE